ncbi:glycine betaine ABC transporter substrate-binding protein [Tenuibacillus multivorans]|uniref:Osmoprotectant transport system substrate-binding protein n=1 Tax=Tenuibacillus multivorans TaxID=237069 RepID=A0A1H0DKQ9_9BACI|nr:glycine betaine ABC transporter substrate-binding protein [Tenuibacillus multivorans]GEL76514.1 glycine/betaine ABC transporter substrate-binding protein [Tenuibacillus multivorans]SDN70639.1 osmoprotectant transport system substrate-binding protein [Tenuibacillus multivorans]
MKKLITVLLSGMFILGACGSGGDDGQITVGAKSFTESLLLAEMTETILQENGYEVDKRTNMGSNVLREAVTSGQVDITWDYTGTGLVTYLGEEPVASAEEAFQQVKEIDAENGITWVNPTGINNTYTLMVRQDFAEEQGVKSMSDLAEYVKANGAKVAVNDEFYARPDGLSALEEHYGFEFGAENVVQMDLGLTYQALRDGEVDVAMGFATDSRIEQFNLMNLEDDQTFFPDYSAATVIRTEVLDNNPEIEELLKPMADNLDSETMIKLNYEVDVEERSVEEVAQEFLTDNGIIE